MEELTQRIFREVSVWKRIDDTTLRRYRCLHVLPDDRYCVKSVDLYYWPLSKEQVSQLDYYYLDSLFQDALEAIIEETYETLEGAILMHDRRLEDFNKV